MKPLHTMPLHERAMLVKSPPSTRLLALGFVPGNVITPRFRAPFGDPTAYEVCGALVALRQEDASSLMVYPLTGGDVPWRK